MRLFLEDMQIKRHFLNSLFFFYAHGCVRGFLDTLTDYIPKLSYPAFLLKQGMNLILKHPNSLDPDQTGL